MSRLCRAFLVALLVVHPSPVVGQSSGEAQEPPAPLPPFIPALTDEDRRTAFPDVQGHAVHDSGFNYFVLADQLEWQRGDSPNAYAWDTRGWIGQDVDRFWFRAEGEGRGGRLDAAEAHLLYGRAVGRWWDLVAGVRQDVRPGRAQTWAAIGIQGLAPYWFEVEATAYIGRRTQFRIATEYEVLLTNRLVLQPLIEVNVDGRDDPARGIRAGLSAAETEVRLRYEIRREFAPYVGVSWHRQLFGTADAAREAGDPAGDLRLVAGVRVWR